MLNINYTSLSFLNHSHFLYSFLNPWAWKEFILFKILPIRTNIWPKDPTMKACRNSSSLGNKLRETTEIVRKLITNKTVKFMVLAMRLKITWILTTCISRSSKIWKPVRLKRYPKLIETRPISIVKFSWQTLMLTFPLPVEKEGSPCCICHKKG